jgi:HK97 family phage portal protein
MAGGGLLMKPFNWIRRLAIRQHPVGSLLQQPYQLQSGRGAEWAPSNYGEYAARSVPVFAAIQLRGTAVARPPLVAYRTTTRAGETSREPVEPTHPLQVLLDGVNPHWTRGDMWRAMESYLGLWGSSYLAITFGPDGVPVELWPLRPDRVRIVPDATKYISGYVYTGAGQQRRGLSADEVIRFRYFNPLDEFAGLSPIAPARLSLDMGLDALQGNRSALANDSSPGLGLEMKDTMTDDELAEFYARWESRFKGPGKKARPAIYAGGMKPVMGGFSPKDLEHLKTMLWTIGDVARVYNIPLPMLHDLTRATYANMVTARRSFWEDCIVPQLAWYREILTEQLVPKFRDPTLSIAFDLTDVEALQEDETQKSLRRKTYVDGGMMTVNEVRGDMGLPASDQPEADLLNIRGAPPAFGGIPAFSAGAKRRREVEWADKGRELERQFRLNLSTVEKRFRRMVNKLFRMQMDEIIASIEEERTVNAVYRESTVLAGLAPGNGLRAEPDPDPFSSGFQLFNQQRWDEEFAEAGRPLFQFGLDTGIKTAIKQFGLDTGIKTASKQFGISISFDVDRPIAEQWITDRTAWWARRINETTGELITDAVRLANEGGESLAQLSERLREIEGFNTSVRSDMTARTEMVGAQNEGHLQAYDEAGIEGKQWLTSIDGRERVSHADAHLQIRRINEDFDIEDPEQGWTKLRSPGQGGPAWAVVNCRCVALPWDESI